jgi:hypothetical protein
MFYFNLSYILLSRIYRLDLDQAGCLSAIILHTLDKFASYGHVPASVVSPKIFVLLVVNTETGMGFLKGDIQR